MPISVQCDSCQHSFKIKDEFAGRKVRCPGCKTSITIPDDDQDDLLDEQADDEMSSPAPRSRSDRGRRPKSTSKSKPSSAWYIQHWHWLVVLGVMLIALVPVVGLVFAMLVSGVGVLMVLIGGVAPFLRIIVSAPGTVLMMIVSRSARFEMMNQPDDHPYKVAVRTAFNPTRGLFWRGVLFIVLFIPAAMLNSFAGELFRHMGRNNNVPVANHPNAPPFVVDPGREFRPMQPGGDPGGMPGGVPGRIPGAMPGGGPGGEPGVRPGVEPGANRIFYVTITIKGEMIPTDSMDQELSALPGYVAGSAELDAEARKIRFQHRGPVNPAMVNPLFAKKGFPSVSFSASTKAPQ
jgi:predicted Zn finger-like uncharacterized protein